jgi:hypothetical protein
MAKKKTTFGAVAGFRYKQQSLPPSVWLESREMPMPPAHNNRSGFVRITGFSSRAVPI